MFRHFCLAAVVAAAGLFAPPMAAAPAAAPARAWNVDWGDQACTLTRTAPGLPQLELRRIPGDYRMDVRLKAADWTRDSFRKLSRLTLALANPEKTRLADAEFGRLNEGGGKKEEGLRFWVEDTAFLDAFAASGAISLLEGDTVRAEISLPQTGQAVAAFRKCEEDGMRAWGMNPAQIAAVRTPPKPLVRFEDMAASTDYPWQALEAGAEGSVLILLGIGVDGRVGACRIAVSSGNADLDRRTCAVFMVRGRFEPARDASGAKIRGFLVQRITWQIG